MFAALGGWPLPMAEKDVRVGLEDDILLDAGKPPNGAMRRRSKETRPELVVELVGSGGKESTATDERGESGLTDEAAGSLLLPRRLLPAELLLCADDAGGEGGLTLACWDATTWANAPLMDDRGDLHAPEELGDLHAPEELGGVRGGVRATSSGTTAGVESASGDDLNDSTCVAGIWMFRGSVEAEESC